MKTKITIITLLALVVLGINRLVAQDLVPGINYSYNPPGSNGVITNITIDVCNNDNTSASSFFVAIYLYDPSNSNYWVLDQTQVNSLSGSSCITISNWNIDINNTSGIPAGNGYRLGIWVDSGSDITESDENNNTGLMSGTISYTPSSGNGIEDVAMAELMPASPNPSSGITKISFDLKKNADIKLDLYNANGQLVKSMVNDKMEKGVHTVDLDCSTLNAGIYYYTLSNGKASATHKLAVVK